MPWSVYFDESGTDGQSSVVVMAGLFAGDGYWTAFEGDWRELLARHRLDEVHVWKLRRALKEEPVRFDAVMKDIEACVLQRVPLTIIAVMRKDDYDAIYKPTEPRSGQKHSQLGLLYRACLSFFAALLEQHPPTKLDRVQFIYEKGPKEGGLRAIHGEFQALEDVDDWFGALSFATREAALPLQAADALASGALQHEMIEHGRSPSDIDQSGLVM